MEIKKEDKKIKLKELILESLKQEEFQISNEYEDWLVATRRIQGLSNATYNIEGKYPTRVIYAGIYNNELEIYMNNGWQVNLKLDLSKSSRISKIKLVGAPVM